MRIRIRSLTDQSTRDFRDPKITFGRDALCEFALAGMNNVSGRHAQIQLSPDAALLSDLGSTNGTFLNDQKIDRPTPVRAGSVFRLGMTGPSFQVVELETANAASAPAGGDWLGQAVGASPKGAREPQRAVAGREAPRPAPSAPGAAPMTHTRAMVVSLQKTNKKLMLTVALSLAVLVIGGLAGGWYLVQKTIDLNEETRKLTDASKSQQETTEKLTTKVGQVSESVGQLSKSDEERIFNAYGDAVWMVGYQEANGRVVHFGTAFAVRENGLFGTNAHISLPVQAELNRKLKFSVFAPGGKLEYPVVSTVTHKDYKDRPGGTVIFQTPDVGLLKVAMPAGAKLPKVVDLASEEDLRKLAPGSPLCYIGYPGWDDAFSYNKLDKIVPYVYPGPLTRILMLNEEAGEFSKQYLIEHDLMTTGGASGSPVFNRAGKVIGIHNTGRYTPITNKDGTTMRVPRLGPKTAMRIDLLQQIIPQ